MEIYYNYYTLIQFSDFDLNFFSFRRNRSNASYSTRNTCTKFNDSNYILKRVSCKTIFVILYHATNVNSCQEEGSYNNTLSWSYSFICKVFNDYTRK